MTYSDCDPDRSTTPESRLRDALEADVARHKTAIRVGFAILREALPPENVHYDAALDAWSLYSNDPTPFAFDVMKQQMAMNNPNHNPYFQGLSAQTGTYRRGPFDNFWVW